MAYIRDLERGAPGTPEGGDEVRINPLCERKRSKVIAMAYDAVALA